LITPRFLWAEIERLASSPSNPEPVCRRDAREGVPVMASSTGSERRKARRIGIFGPSQKRAKFTIPRPQETEKNTRIIQGLEKIYGVDKTRTVLEQAETIFHVSNPLVETNPETYELFENGQIDEALELFNATWVIGRPRLD